MKEKKTKEKKIKENLTEEISYSKLKTKLVKFLISLFYFAFK